MFEAYHVIKMYWRQSSLFSSGKYLETFMYSILEYCNMSEHEVCMQELKGSILFLKESFLDRKYIFDFKL